MDEVRAYLECMGSTIILDNLMGIRWAKLIVNTTFSGMSAALGCTFGDVMDNDKSLLCVKYIANECIKVSRADGVKMEPIQGLDLDNLLFFETTEQRDANTPYVHEMWGPHRALRASMLQDLEKGRKCEIDAINGVVCALGDKLNIDTPVNDKVTEVVKGIENGKYKLTFDNIDLFEIPEKI
jgi:2-dehydropantoate 2-reductase